MKRTLGAFVLACAFAASSAVTSAAKAPRAEPSAATRPTLSALDLIELQISYTTILARFYRTIAPRTLVDGARTGVASDLIASGITTANLPFTPERVSAGEGDDLIDSLVLRSLARYGSRLDGHRLVQDAVAGELGALRDPYSVLFHPPAFHKFNAFLGNEAFGGIGAVISLDDATKIPVVDRVLPGSPAELAGVKHGDRIESIDGKPVTPSAADVRDQLRGTVGTSVRLGIVRDGTAQSVTLVRARVRDPEVRTARFGDVGYAALGRFGDRAGEELGSTLRDFKTDGVRSVVLDLRDNGGGYGDEATAVASAFVKGGPIFTTRERTGVPAVSLATGAPLWSGPLIVLVNGDTASAAEIVAGAVADDGAGLLVGTPTFGKGLVQSIFPLPDGSALKLTTARYTTPKGRDIDRVGITPNIVVPEPAGSVPGDPAMDPQLERALRVLAEPAPSPTPSSAA